MENKEILGITKQIDKIFEGSKSCTDCPRAQCRTVTVAKCRGTIYSKQAGCCSMCSENKAYFAGRGGDLNNSFNKKFEILKDKFGWDWIHGFFDMERKSCKLPRYYRSHVCQRYLCGSLGEEIQKNWKGPSNLSAGNFLSRLCEELGNIRHKLKQLN